MSKKFRQVHPEDFDVEMLMAAAREGKLFVEISEKSVRREDLADSVKQYVSRAKVYVTNRFRKEVDDIWDELLDDERFIDFLMPSNKARKCRDFNKYGVMRIIGVLREKGVYEAYSERKFDALLEESGGESPYRRYLDTGIEERELLLFIRQLVAKHEV